MKVNSLKRELKRRGLSLSHRFYYDHIGLRLCVWKKNFYNSAYVPGKGSARDFIKSLL